MQKEEFYLRSTDGQTDIHGYLWRPEGKAVAALQIAHGMMEHIDRYDRFASWLAERGVAVIGHDHLGHGKSCKVCDLSFFAEKRGSVYLIQDMFRVTKVLELEYPEVPHILLGHSMGSFMARRYLTVHGGYLDGLIVMGTGAQPLGLAVAGKLTAMMVGALKGKRHQSSLMQKVVLGSYNAAFRPNRTSSDWLSRDEKEVDAFVRDPYCNIPFTCQAYVDFFNILMDLGMKRQFKKIPKTIPVLFISGDKDPVGDCGKGVQKVYRQFVDMGMEHVTIQLYPDARHEILNEVNRQEVFEDIWDWMKGCSKIRSCYLEHNRV